MVKSSWSRVKQPLHVHMYSIFVVKRVYKYELERSWNKSENEIQNKPTTFDLSAKLMQLFQWCDSQWWSLG